MSEATAPRKGGNTLLALALLAGAGWCCYDHAPPCPDGKCPPARPAPRAPEPKRPDKPKPKRPLVPRPWGGEAAPSVEGHVGGPSHQGAEIDCDLPGERFKRNIASKGLGCCVFRSLDHAGDWQNVEAVQGFPEWMVKNGVAGGGYPSKVAQLVPRIAASKGLPEPDFLQVEGPDLEVLKRASKSGRMLCVTYSYSPTGRYGGKRISHMVNVVSTPEPGSSEGWWVVLDNNYVTPAGQAYEWLSTEEFRGTYAPGGRGWAVILLSPGPPPPPKNK